MEGLGTPDNLHPLQAAFHEAHGLQCGFCTPGILMTLLPFLEENPNPTEQDVRLAISGHGPAVFLVTPCFYAFLCVLNFTQRAWAAVEFQRS